MHLRGKLFKLSALFTEIILKLEKLLAKLSVFFISEVDQVEIVLVLEAEIVEGSVKVGDFH